MVCARVRWRRKPCLVKTDVWWRREIKVTSENKGRCRPESAAHSLFCELRRLEIVKSDGDLVLQWGGEVKEDFLYAPRSCMMSGKAWRYVWRSLTQGSEESWVFCELCGLEIVKSEGEIWILNVNWRVGSWHWHRQGANPTRVVSHLISHLSKEWGTKIGKRIARISSELWITGITEYSIDRNLRRPIILAWSLCCDVLHDHSWRRWWFWRSNPSMPRVYTPSCRQWFQNLCSNSRMDLFPCLMMRTAGLMSRMNEGVRCVSILPFFLTKTQAGIESQKNIAVLKRAMTQRHAGWSSKDWKSKSCWRSSPAEEVGRN